MGLRPRWKRDPVSKLTLYETFDDSRRQYALLNKGHSHRNSTSLSDYDHPIHQLPVEILQKIFTCVAEPRLPDQDPFLQLYPEWIAITYVCRHWRTVALNHHSLWGTITPNLSFTWLKILMARSEPAQVDVELRIGQLVFMKRMCLSVDEAIALLSDCTRMRSLRLLGPRGDVCAALDALRITSPIHSLTLSLWEPGPPIFLSEDLFGGQAPIRRIHFTADRCIVAPRWLLRGITHFTSGEQILLLDLLDSLRQMPALAHFTLQNCRARWEDTDAPREPLIELPHLKEFSVHSDSPRYFVLLNQRLALPRGAKRRMELRTLAVAGWDRWLRWFYALLPIIEAANGLQHVYLSGGAKEGTFRVWSGDMDTTYEDAEFSFEMYWYGSPMMTTMDQRLTSPIFHLGGLCDLLGATKCGRTLVLGGDPTPTRVKLPALCWWMLLKKLPAVEELGLRANVVKVLYTAWKQVGAPAVLPALHLIHVLPANTATTIVEQRPLVAPPIRKGFISRIVPSKMAKRPNSPARAVVSVPSTNVPDDILPSSAQFPELHDEKLLDGLIKLLQGGSGPLGTV
jgi:hypothetical protein